MRDSTRSGRSSAPARASKDTGKAASKSGATTVHYTLQVAAYTEQADADQEATKLRNLGLDARVVGSVKPFRVRIGLYDTRAGRNRGGRRFRPEGSADHDDRDRLRRRGALSGASTPLMQQYREIKARHHHAILFFRMGEFYEMFYEDAETASRVLGITLTARNNGGAAEVPLAGVPVKAASDYIRRLVQHGFRVAICEQMEDPRSAKGVVRREVVETVTPGAAFADDLLDHGRSNYVCAVLVSADGRGAQHVGVAAADVSTGELRLLVVRPAELEPTLARLAPRELVVPSTGNPEIRAPAAAGAEGALVTQREPWDFDVAAAGDDLAKHYHVQSLEGLGIDAADAPAVGAAGALLRYLRELQPAGLPQLARPTIERPGGVMPLDEMTRRNLELVESLRGGGNEGTLLSVMDRTRTPMGARLLRQWVLAPLTDRERRSTPASTASRR